MGLILNDLMNLSIVFKLQELDIIHSYVRMHVSAPQVARPTEEITGREAHHTEVDVLKFGLGHCRKLLKHILRVYYLVSKMVCKVLSKRP